MKGEAHGSNRFLRKVMLVRTVGAIRLIGPRSMMDSRRAIFLACLMSLSALITYQCDSKKEFWKDFKVMNESIVKRSNRFQRQTCTMRGEAQDGSNFQSLAMCVLTAGVTKLIDQRSMMALKRET